MRRTPIALHHQDYTADAAGNGRLVDNDLRNARDLVRRHGRDLRYCHDLGCWLHWDGVRWRFDDAAGEVMRRAQATVDEAAEANRRRMREVANRLIQEPDNEQLAAEVGHLRREAKRLVKAGNGKELNMMIRLAQCAAEVVVPAHRLDADPWLFNAANGTIDLRNGKLRSHDRGDLLTEAVAIVYDSRATCPLWERFLGDVFQGDGDTIAFIQRWVGYCLTGDVSEQKALLFHGGGGNGKSLLVKVVLELLGPYAFKASHDLLTESAGDRHPTELTDLRGKRLSLVSETTQGKRLRIALFKDVTGGEPVRARKMRQDFFEFRPTAKFIISTNHRPEVEDNSDAVWRRLLVVPFRGRFGDADDAERLGWEEGSYRPKDPCLASALLDELPGILAWAVRGCLEWRRLGSLREPASVRAEVRHYREEQDLLAQFVAERCVTGPGERVKATPLLVAYNAWLETNGEKTISAKGLASQLKAKGFERISSNGAIYLRLALRTGRASEVPAEGRPSGHGRRRRAG